MDAKTEKLCLDEIDHLVLDADKKINLQYVSNTWNLPFKDSEAILQKWLKNYSGKKKIVKEYIIRGTDKNGNAVITIIPELKLEKMEAACPNHKRFLYSIEVGSLNGKTLDLPELAENKFIALKLDLGKRDIKVNDIVVPPPAKKVPEPKKNTLFGAAKPKQTAVPEVKTEKTSPISSKNSKVSSPKKESPKKNQSAAKTSMKPPQGKSSIANFFGSKPSSSSSGKFSTDKSIAEATVKIEKVEIKEEPSTSNDTKSLKSSHKRNLSNTSDSMEDSVNGKTDKNKSKPSSKKLKLEPKSARSRLMQICDSSEDEDEPSNENSASKMDVDEEVPVKKEKENKTPSPDKKQNDQSNGTKRRAKKKKLVTRTYEDDDGFINTVREMEEVSCSDEEPEVVEPPAKKPAPVAISSTTGKKKISPPAGKKQGSILNFFSKK